ncbi:hypothetical protein MRX96_011596 [Rhipicephalus microplus]
MALNAATDQQYHLLDQDGTTDDQMDQLQGDHDTPSRNVQDEQPSEWTLTFLCLTLVVALVTQEAQASKLKKVAKYALIGAALAPRVVPIPIPVGHHAHYEPHYDHGWHAGLHGSHGWW